MAARPVRAEIYAACLSDALAAGIDEAAARDWTDALTGQPETAVTAVTTVAVEGGETAQRAAGSGGGAHTARGDVSLGCAADDEPAAKRPKPAGAGGGTAPAAAADCVREYIVYSAKENIEVPDLVPLLPPLATCDEIWRRPPLQRLAAFLAAMGRAIGPTGA